MRSVRSGPASWALALAAAGVRARRQADYEWWGSPFHEAAKRRVKARELAATPRDFRPGDRERGLDLLEGRFVLAGAFMEVGPDGDPWDRPSPSRRFAEDLHRFRWLRHLLATGEPGAREALRLTLEWEEAFGRWSHFSWSGAQLAPRVHALACGARRMSAVAPDELERAALFNSLLRQADHLSRLKEGPTHAAEQACAAAVAASALAGGAAARIAARALQRLGRALDACVLPDGGHRSRSPEAALELLLQLLTLDDLLLQRGREAPKAVGRAIDRLGSAVRFFTLGDGALACFHGGESSDPISVAASRLHEDEPARPFGYAPHSRYHRLNGPRLQVVVDAGPPAPGPWSPAACAQPAALNVSGDSDRLITNSGWSPNAGTPSDRLSPAGSTVTVAEDTPAVPIRGWAARVLGPRLVGGPAKVQARRNEMAGGVWIVLRHDGWAPRYGLNHERRLFLDIGADELRGEDRLTPAGGAKRARKGAPYAARFHLHPDVRASIARDGRSVLLVGPSERGWWFRNDSADVRLEPSTHYVEGVGRRGLQIVLRGEARPPSGARVRWKLSPAEFPEGAGPPRPEPAEEAHA